jgi:hypothetical protein
MLRELVRSHILKNPEIYQSSLLAAATEAFANPANKNENAIISRFIDCLKENGFWGGESLQISSKQKFPLFIHIDLYFEGKEIIKNHYDAILRILPNDGNLSKTDSIESLNGDQKTSSIHHKHWKKNYHLSVLILTICQNSNSITYQSHHFQKNLSQSQPTLAHK